MRITSGDKVSYQGEVWEVEHVAWVQNDQAPIVLRRMGKGKYYQRKRTQLGKVKLMDKAQ